MMGWSVMPVAYCGSMPASRAAAVHFTISARMKSWNSAGVCGAVLRPISAMRVRVVGIEK